MVSLWKYKVQRDRMGRKDVWGLYFFLIAILNTLRVISIMTKRPATLESAYLNHRYY